MFSAAGRNRDWLDVFLAAMVRGDWNDVEQRVLRGLRLDAALEDSPDWPDDDRVREAANAFRYDRDLLTAEELTTWLDARELTLDGWTAFFARRLAREESSADAVDDGAEVEISDEVFAVEGICSGDFDRLATRLAGRIAAVADSGEATPVSGDAIEELVTRVLAANAPWLEGLDRANVAGRLHELAGIEERFSAVAAAAITGRALATEVARHLIDWTRIDLERLSYMDIDTAREAALCVREDGMSLSDVAVETGTAVGDLRGLLEEIEPELRDPVLSADVDSLVGPVQVGERHELAWVVGRMPARLDDPLVRARAEQAVVDRLLAKAILAHVRWT